MWWRPTVSFAALFAFVAVALLANPWFVGSGPGHEVRPYSTAPIAGSVTSSLRSLPASGWTVSTVWIGTAPNGLAYDSANGYVYVADENRTCGAKAGNVTMVSGTTVLGKVRVGVCPIGAIYDPTSGDVEVDNYFTDNVSIIAGSSVVTTLRIGANPQEEMAFDSGNGDVYIPNIASGNVSVLHGTNFVGSVSVGTYPGTLTYDSGNGFVYVSNCAICSPPTTDSVSVISGTTVVATIPVGVAPDVAAYDPGNGYVYVPNQGSNNVSVISGTTVIASIPVGAWPAVCVYDSTTGDVYVSNTQSANVTVISGTSVVANVAVGSVPVDLLIDPGNGDAFVANTASASVSILSGAAVVASLAVGNDPRWMAYDSSSGAVYVTNFNSNNVSAIFPSGSSTLASVAVTPAFASLSVGGSQTFTATPTCTGGACPAGTTYSWSMNRALGSLNATTGSVVQFTAGGTPGLTNLFVNATLNAVTVRNAAVPISITSGGSTHYTVTFAVHPTSCPIAFNGTSQSSGSTGSYLVGTYAIQANPCANFVFQQWNTSGGVVVQRPTSAGGFANVTGNGALTAYYVWSGRHLGTGNVTFVISPSSCGPVVFGGINENNGAIVAFTKGNYSADAPACTGYAFNKWTATGSLTLPGLAGNPTTVGVWGNGTLTASYTWVPPPPHYTLQFGVSPGACGPVLFNGTAQADATSAPFLAATYPAHAPACAGYRFQNWEYLPTGGGMHLYTTAWANISIWANGTVSAYYSPAPLSVTLATNATSTVVGSPVVLTPSVSGGPAPYTCVWSLNGTNTTQTGCGALTLSWPHPGTYSYRTWATDSAAQTAESNVVTIAVSSLPSSSPPKLVAFANASAPNTGIYEPCSGPENFLNETLTGSARGGSPSYTFWWNFGDGSRHAEGRNVSHAYGPGFYRAELSVLDAQGRNGSTNISISISPSTQPCMSSSSQPSYLWAFVATAAALLVATLAVIFLRRRRRVARSPPDGPSPPLGGVPVDPNRDFDQQLRLVWRSPSPSEAVGRSTGQP